MTDKTPAIPNLIDDEEVLSSIKTLDDALAFVNDHGIAVADIEDFGTGFHPVDKATLVGVPFVALGHKFVTGDFGPMVVIFAVTKNNDKVIIVDGSTGIKAQLEGYAKRGLNGPFKVERGLTRSDYTYKDKNGNEKSATTFYLSS
jgi:hypothetical protein